MPQHVGMQRKRHKGNNVRIPHSGECGAGHISAIGGRDKVADICAGSGTTAVAALNTGRRFVCFETAPAFYGPATERIRRARGFAGQEYSFAVSREYVALFCAL